jgi:quercetin dioxygenase-like cupin family protein
MNVDGLGEWLLAEPDPDKWVLLKKTGVEFNTLWENPETGASIALLRMPPGAGMLSRHSHASNQFMYCLEGEYEYLSSGHVLKAGSFYWNPIGSEHGPTKARTACLLLEIYDGPHYLVKPEYLN